MKSTLLDEVLEQTTDAAEREMLRATWERMAALETIEPSPAMERRFARSLEIAAAAPVSSPVRRLLPAAAALLVGVAVGALALRGPLDGERPELSRWSRVVSTAVEPGELAPRRLEAVQALAGFADRAEARRLLIEVLTGDPSIDVRLCAVDALESHAAEPDVTTQLIETAGRDPSVLLRLRLLQLFVDRELDAAHPAIESLSVDPDAGPLVREAAEWAARRLSERRSS